MDPLTALGLAASVVQFLQFGGSLVFKSRQIYVEGGPLDHVECENAAKRLSELTKKVKESLNYPGAVGSHENRALEIISDNCIKLSEELLFLLKGLQLDNNQKYRKWKSFRQALKSISSKGKVDGIASQLSCYRDELNAHIIVSIREKVEALALQQKQGTAAVNEGTQKAIQTLLENREVIQKALLEQAEIISQSNNEQHAKTRATIYTSIEESAEIQILESLRFHTMRDRYIEITEAHQMTFRWALEKPSRPDAENNNFAEWLESGTGLYWINGKAGSGKSTLMRYIFDSPRTEEHLQVWANGAKLEVSGFFFWNSGSLQQRSQVGLFRSLLHQALQKSPNLVRHIFPEKWAEISSSRNLKEVLARKWTLRELQHAFNRWIDFAPATLKVCLFIDGLDEYEGDHETIAEFFKEISSSSSFHIKICVSSRPLIVFDEAFRRFPSLRLQDITFGDIQAYVYHELRGHRYMKKLEEQNPSHATELVDEIVTKASGVFLWVTLVVRSLLNGLRNRDNIDDLKRRLQELPANLSSLYTHMLNHVEPFYKEQASQAFQIYHSISTMQQDEYSRVSAIEFDFAVVEAMGNMRANSRQPLTDSEIKSICEHIDVHLKSRCAGLLEVYDPKKENSGRYIDRRSILRVNYLHRTVKEFLETDNVRATLLEATGPSFSPDVAVVMAYVTRLKRSVLFNHMGDLCKPNNSERWATISRAMPYAKRIDVSKNIAYIAILDELERVGLYVWQYNIDPWYGDDKIPGFYKGPRERWSNCDKSRKWRRNFLLEATAQGLLLYVDKRIKEDKNRVTSSQDIHLALLLRYITPPWNTETSIDEGKPPDLEFPCEMVELLLKHGVDPNQDYMGPSLWRAILTWVHRHDWKRSTHELTPWARMMKTLIEYGANPHASCDEKYHSLWKRKQDLRRQDPRECCRYHSYLCSPQAEEGDTDEFLKFIYEHTCPCSCDDWEITERHTVWDVIGDIFDRFLPFEGAELRRMLKEQQSLSKLPRHHKPTYAPTLTKRLGREFEEHRSGKRIAYDNRGSDQ